MNSKQRRHDRRTWKHKVLTNRVTYDEYVERWEWLNTRHGRKVARCGWRERIVDDIDFDLQNITWEFLKEKDAIEFALRWA